MPGGVGGVASRGAPLSRSRVDCSPPRVTCAPECGPRSLHPIPDREQCARRERSTPSPSRSGSCRRGYRAKVECLQRRRRPAPHRRHRPRAGVGEAGIAKGHALRLHRSKGALKATASFMGSAGPTARRSPRSPAAALRSSRSRPFCGPMAAFMRLRTARSTPSCTRSSGGDPPYSYWCAVRPGALYL